ncbi:MAG TPA: ice-binding family protein [Candidatus Sulfotelmatobacter sp.]|nr:ice-binding family protein [Candidatus Sulfotelmatobacter sp.]
MKKIFLTPASRKRAQRIPIGLGLAITLAFLHNAGADEVYLGTANNYAVLAGSTITSTGPTVINGGLGLSPGSAVTGSPIVNGAYDVDNAPAVQAQNDLTTAFNTAAGLAPNQNLTGQDLGGLTLTPGVYFFASTAQLTGLLTLNDLGNPDAVFVFQIGSTLTTASDSSVVTINDGGSTTPGISTFWEVGSSATLGTATAFQGNILAETTITADTGATVLDGRLLAINGAVNLDDNTITAPPAEVVGSPVPDTGNALLLLGSALAALVAFGRRFPSGNFSAPLR